MDDLQFDRLAKTLGVGCTRRATTRLLAGGTLGALLLGRLGLQPALAACRGPRHTCNHDDQCCSDHCKQGFCKCKNHGKCDNDKACCSGKCHHGKCEHVKGDVDAHWGCDPKKYYCFKTAADFPKGTPVSFSTVEVPTCFTYLPNEPCLPGHGQCPRTPCQACNERFPRECAGGTRDGGCHAGDRYYFDPSARNRLVC